MVNVNAYGLYTNPGSQFSVCVHAVMSTPNYEAAWTYLTYDCNGEMGVSFCGAQSLSIHRFFVLPVVD